MNVSMNCKISLSKKLRALIGKEGSITLITHELIDGKGQGSLSISGENIDIDKNTFDGETSIQLEAVGGMNLEVGGEDAACSNIFSSIPNKVHSEKIINKIAAVNAPEKSEVPNAIKNKQQVNEEATIAKSIPSPLCKKWIADMDQLMLAVNKAKHKISDVDVTTARTDREKIVLMEMKERDEAIEDTAWIINDKVGNLSINDLRISLPLNMPYDLSYVSARRIAASRDLKILIRDGYVRFISPKEKDVFLQKTVGSESDFESLEVFDNHEEAEAALGNKKNPVISEDAVEITAKDIENPTEEENSILNLTQNMPTVKQPRQVQGQSTEPRHTVHGSNPSSPKPAMKTVVRKED